MIPRVYGILIVDLDFLSSFEEGSTAQHLSVTNLFLCDYHSAAAISRGPNTTMAHTI